MGTVQLASFVPQQISLRAQVANHLRDLILSGNLKPGEKVVEATLAKTLKVGQITVRGALQILEHEGLIFKKANTASFVAQLSQEQVAEIVDVRRDLEPNTFALAHRRKTSADLDDLRNLVSKIEEAVEKGDYHFLGCSDLAFHRKVWRMAGNRTRERFLTLLCTPLFGYIQVYMSITGFRLRDRVKSHQILLDALAGPDEEQAIQASLGHIGNSWFKFLPDGKNGETF